MDHGVSLGGLGEVEAFRVWACSAARWRKLLEIWTVARELFWRGRLNDIDIEVLIGGGWTPPRWA